MAITFGRRVRYLREGLLLTQGDLSARLTQLGVQAGRTYISEIERSDRIPSAEVVAGLARALNTTADYLLGLIDNPAQPKQVIQDEWEVQVDRLQRASLCDQRNSLALLRALAEVVEARDAERQLLDQLESLDASGRSVIGLVANALRKNALTSEDVEEITAELQAFIESRLSTQSSR